MLLGRDDELDHARRLLDSGPGLVVTGEAGVGKTALLTAALAGQHRVRSGQCFRSLGWTVGAPLEQAMGTAMPAGDVTWAARWVAEACRGHVLRIDDVQWADPHTLDVLVQLAGRVPLAVSLRAGENGSERALSGLRGAGLSVLMLSPLPVGTAAELARHRHPALRPAEAQALAERCGCNPLLIEELGADGAAGPGLRRSVLARLRRLGAQPRADFTVLALAGIPLPDVWLPAASELADAGLVIAEQGQVQPRHPLVAEVVVAEMDPAVRREHDLDLAGRAAGHGHAALAARGYHAAGEPAEALPLALTALDGAATPGDRAALLHLAATCAVGASAHELATRAIGELVAAGEYARAGELLAVLPETDDPHRLGLVGRIRWQTGDDDAALAAFEAGLQAAAGDEPERVLLLAEFARAKALTGGDPRDALRLATDAHAAAQRHGVELVRALAVLGTVEHFAGEAVASLTHLREALDQAEAGSEDVQVEFTTANNLIAAYEANGDGALACELGDRYARRAEALHLGRWHEQMLAMAHNARLHLGDYDRVLAEVPELLAGGLDPRTRDQLEVTLGLALADVGRCDESRRRLDAALTVCADDHSGRGNVLWVLSECQLWSGDPATAIVTADEALALMPESDLRFFPLLTIAQARLRLGQPVEPTTMVPTLPMLAGASLELAAAVTLAGGDRTGAAAGFDRAAAAWSGHHLRGELRCRWLAAENAGDTAALLALADELETAGWTPLLGQVRRSLRASGVHRGASRGRAGALTAREREVLDLVAAGRTTAEIAARLGLSPTTVTAQIASARSRVGAHTRWQAAAGS